MFVSNYWNFIFGSQQISSHYIITSDYPWNSYGCVGVDGEPAHIAYGGYGDIPYTSERFADINLRPYTYLSLGVGSGTTDPAFHDYNLESDLSASLEHVTSNITLGADGDCLKIIGTISGVNNSGSDITITEVGLFKGYTSNTYDYSTPTAKLLYARLLLDEPLVVKNRTGFQKTFEFVGK